MARPPDGSGSLRYRRCPTVNPVSNRPPRRPKFGAFLITGAVIGLIVAIVVNQMGPDPAGYSGRTVFGFLGLAFAGLGALLAGIVAVLLDRKP
jgi:uncharacterized membrane protein YgaE (UPF0421/DUF939 family)